MGKLSPIVSEFDRTEDAEAYERWFRAKVQASLKDGRPSVPHATVMAELDAIVDQAVRRPSRRGQACPPDTGAGASACAAPRQGR